MRTEPGARTRPAGGFSLVELLIIVAVVGITVLIGASTWVAARKRANCSTAAKMVKTFMLRARMLAVYRGLHHFIVLDPATNSLSIYADTSAPIGTFTTADTRVAREALPSSARLALPAAPSPLANPLGGSTIADAWALPLPDTSGAWGTNLRGVRMTPSGQIQSVEVPPQMVVSGVMVFSDQDGNTSSVGVRGQTGAVRGFQLLDTAWGEL